MGMGRWEGERAIGRWRQGKKESGEREREKKKDHSLAINGWLTLGTKQMDTGIR